MDIFVKKAIFLGVNALGDTLCTTPVIRAFRRANPGTAIVYLAQAAPFCRILDGNPDIDLLLYSERLYFNGIPDNVAAWLATLPLDLRDQRAPLSPGSQARVHDDGGVPGTHQPVVRAAVRASRPNRPGPSSCSPTSNGGPPGCLPRRPFIVFSSHSVSNPDRPDGNGKRKDWPHERWQELARRIAQLGEFDIYPVGSERDEAPALEGVRRLYGLPIKVVAALLESAACVVTVENGIGHLCHAVDAASVVIYSDLMPLEWANPAEVDRSRACSTATRSICPATTVLAAIQHVF